jgi:preprotein translocase subunit SecG
MGFLDWLLLIISVLLIALVMLQESKDDVKNTFSGEKSELFKNQKQRGPELFLNRLTMGMSVVFAVVTILALVL